MPMEQEQITLQSLTTDEHVSVGYSDDDVVIVENVRNLVNPPSARTSMNMMAICIDGRGQGSINGQLLTLSKNQVLILPPNVTFSDFMISPDFEFKAMFFTTRILQSFLREKISIWNEAMYIRHIHVAPLNEGDINFYIHFYDMLRLCIDADKSFPFRTEVIQALLRAAFLGLTGWMMQWEAGEEKTSASATTTAGTLFQRFLNLLEATDVKHRTVESYASELCVTAKYLSAVCKKASGKTANEWITERVLEDIRYQLCHTDHTIKHICALLGFPNPSFFGKYVREPFGMTPLQLRKSS